MPGPNDNGDDYADRPKHRRKYDLKADSLFSAKVLPPPTGLAVGIGMPVVALVLLAVPLIVVMLLIEDVFELWKVGGIEEEELDNGAKEKDDGAAEAPVAVPQSTLN